MVPDRQQLEHRRSRSPLQGHEPYDRQQLENRRSPSPLGGRGTDGDAGHSRSRSPDTVQQRSAYPAGPRRYARSRSRSPSHGRRDDRAYYAGYGPRSRSHSRGQLDDPAFYDGPRPWSRPHRDMGDRAYDGAYDRYENRSPSQAPPRWADGACDARAEEGRFRSPSRLRSPYGRWAYDAGRRSPPRLPDRHQGYDARERSPSRSSDGRRAYEGEGRSPSISSDGRQAYEAGGRSQEHNGITDTPSSSES